MPKTASKDPAKPTPNTAPKPVAAKPVASRAAAKGDHIFLVDGSGYIFRAYHALPPLTRPDFLADSAELIAILRQKTPAEIATLMSLSDKLAARRPRPPSRIGRLLIEG